MAATICKRGHDLTAPDAWYEFQGGRKRTCAECRKISEAKRSRRKNPIIPPPPQPLDDIVYTPGTELCVQRPDAWTDQDIHTQELAAATCLLCPLLDACRAAIDDMEPVWGTQDTIWAGETPGQRERRREAGGAMHQPRQVHVVPGQEAGDWLRNSIPNARRKVRI